MEKQKLKRSIINVVIIIAFFIIGGCNSERDMYQDRIKNDELKYLAVLNGKLGYLRLPGQSIDTIDNNGDIYVTGIAGIIDKNTVVITGGTRSKLIDFRQLSEENLY